MSRPPPQKLDGTVPRLRFVLSQEQASEIGVQCGVALTERAKADLEEALEHYLNSVVECAEAPTVEAAEKRLEKMRRLAGELRELVGIESDDPMERALNFRLCADLNASENIANELSSVLGKFKRAVARVQESVTVRRDWPVLDAECQLANDLDIIWQHRLDQKRTISGANKGSSFVRFAKAATESLPSHFPWRPNGRCKHQSIEAFAKALFRSLNLSLDG